MEINTDNFLIKPIKEKGKTGRIPGVSIYKYTPGTYEYKKHVYLKNVYGITLDDYITLLENQEYCCAICNKHKDKFEKDLSVDHCHTTGKVRGLLCPQCNHAIGKFEDNIEILYNAINYLKRTK